MERRLPLVVLQTAPGELGKVPAPGCTGLHSCMVPAADQQKQKLTLLRDGRHLDRLEHRAIISDVELGKGKGWVLHLGLSNAGQRTGWERGGWRAALQEGSWGCW